MKKYLVKQHDESDCGASCLYSIIKYYKGYVPLEVIKVDTLTSGSGTNFYHLKTAGERYGFDVIGKKVRELKDIRLPCIAQLNIDGYYHFVIIYKIDQEIMMADPAKGIVKMNESLFKTLFTGNILEFIPKGQIIKYQKNNYFNKLIKNIYQENIKSLILLFSLIFIIIVLALFSSFNLLLIQNKSLIYLILIILFSKVLLSYLKNIIMAQLNKKINASLLKTYTNHIINLPLKYLQLKKPGDFVNRINDLHGVKDFFSKTLIEVLINLIFLISSLIILFALNKQLTLILLSLTIIYLVLISFMNNGLYHKIVNVIESDNYFMDCIVEYLSKIKTIKTLGSNYFINNTEKRIDNNLNYKIDLDYKLAKVDFVKSLFEEGMIFLILFLFIKAKINYEILIIYMTVYNYYFNSAKFLVDLVPVYLYFKEVINRLKSVYDLDTTKKEVLLNHSGGVYINNLDYSYDNLNKLFNNFNLIINPQTKVLLKGTNGSGKSTLLEIISGLYDDYGGKVNRPSKISYIDQNSYLFSGTILNNIILDNEYDCERFKTIESILDLKKVIENKSGGYQTNINVLTNLSGGEKQKIILARTLYRDFNLLIMDESLSEVAQDKRKEILKKIINYYHNKTIIYVSHQDEDINFNQRVYLTAREEKYVNR